MTLGSADPSAGEPYAIIAGYGIPGRVAEDSLEKQGIRCCVIERNNITVDRCQKSHIPIIQGDATQPEILMKAGIERATLFISAIPDEVSSIAAVKLARKMNPLCWIVARLTYISAGMQAERAGANQVIVAEQVVADEFMRVLSAAMNPPHHG